ncbi:hypothetical protein KI387_004823, partial [Taxus chinensis]
MAWSKLFWGMIERRISNWAEREGKRAKGQAGFRPKHSTIDHCITLKHLIEKVWDSQGEEAFCCFVDFKKVFDTVPRDKLWNRMEELGIPDKFRAAVHRLYEQVRAKIKTREGMSECFGSDIGVKQGCPLSPTSFGLYIDKLEEWLHNTEGGGVQLAEYVVKLLLYADDLILISTTAQGLREHLKAVELFCQEVGMQVNIDKTKIVIFSLKRKGTHTNFLFEGRPLEIVTEYKYLGIDFHHKLSWETCRAKRIQGGWKTSYSLQNRCRKAELWDWNTKKTLFGLLVTPVALYGCEVWGSNMSRHWWRQVERIQKHLITSTLKVKSTVPYEILLAEAGMLPMEASAITRLISYLKKVESMDNHRWPKMVIEDNLERRKTTWMKQNTKWMEKWGIHFQECPNNNREIKNYVAEKFRNIMWTKNIGRKKAHYIKYFNPTWAHDNKAYLRADIKELYFEAPHLVTYFGFSILQATLADSFLADLDDLSDNDVPLSDHENDDTGEEAENDDEMVDVESLKYDDLDSVSKLQKSQRYLDIMQKVKEALQKGSEIDRKGIVLEDEPEYQVIVDCNALSVDIENEIVIIHNFIRDHYRLKFPELESLVQHPIDYARVVKKIGNETDLTLVDLEGLLPSAIIMVVSITASTTSGKPLSEENLQKTLDACDRALNLDEARKMVLEYVESRMGNIAPNLSAIVGSAVAAKLMGTAGGLTSLAKIPACNVQLLGAKKKTLAGFSNATSQLHVGFIEQTEIFQKTPPALRMRACRLLAAKATLAARVDSTRGDPTGKTGRTIREEIRKKIDKWQEPPPAKQPKPLPVPDSESKKKRGGRRLRKMKERYLFCQCTRRINFFAKLFVLVEKMRLNNLNWLGIFRYAVTDMRKLANRMQFGVAEESSLGDGLGEGYGMLGQAGSGKLRVSVGQSNLAAKVAKRFKEKHSGSSGATSGLTSSLAFTPVQ